MSWIILLSGLLFFRHFRLQWDTHLLDPEMLRKGSEFYLTVAVWLQLQLEKAAKVNGLIKLRMIQDKR